jgi:hypothetical protein
MNEWFSMTETGGNKRLQRVEAGEKLETACWDGSHHPCLLTAHTYMHR